MSDEPATRRLLVQGAKTFMLTIPANAHVTFGPWSPPSEKGEERYSAEGKRGTLRVYGPDKKLILGVFSGVVTFRDLSAISYAEQVERVETETVWRDDEKGYFRQSKGTRETAWVEPAPALESPFGETPRDTSF